MVYEYLRQYAEKFDLMRRIRFRTRLLVAEKAQQGWRLQVETSVKEEHGQIPAMHSSSVQNINCHSS